MCGFLERMNNGENFEYSIWVLTLSPMLRRWEQVIFWTWKQILISSLIWDSWNFEPNKKTQFASIYSDSD